MGKGILISMKNSDAHDFVVKELASAKTADQVIYGLCERYGLDWGEAEALVREARLEHGHEITQRQAPWLVAIGLVTFVGGAVTTLYSGYRLLGITLALLNEQGLAWAGIAVYGVQNVAGLAFGLVTGIAMVAGSLIGMKDMWVALLESLEGLFSGNE